MKDLKQLLKEHLNIVVEKERNYDGTKLRVTIKYDNEDICDDFIYIEYCDD